MQTSPFSLLAALSLLTIARGFDARSNNTLAEAYIPPGPPQGARIVNFKPSKLTRASVPVFANSLFVTKGISNAKRGATLAGDLFVSLRDAHPVCSLTILITVIAGIVGLTGKGRDGSQTFPDLVSINLHITSLSLFRFHFC